MTALSALSWQRIESTQNPRLKQLGLLLSDQRARQASGLAVIEGPHLLTALLDSGQLPEAIWCGQLAVSQPEITALLRRLSQLAAQTKQNISLYQTPDRLLQQVSDLSHSQPLLAVIAAPQLALSEWQPADTLILDRLQDAGNVGTLLRSAVACGVQQVIALKGTAQLWSPKVMRAGMGAHFSIRLFIADDVAAILTCYRQFATVALTPASASTHPDPQAACPPLYLTHLQQSTSVYELQLQTPAIWVVGHEGQGIHPDWLAASAADDSQSTAINAADTKAVSIRTVHIPMAPGIESLNAAVAGSVCLFEQWRQRQQIESKKDKKQVKINRQNG